MMVENQRTKTLLIVDDEPMILRLLKLRFGDDGYEVVVTPSGREAIEHARAGNFFAVLLDLGLKDIGGMDVLKEIKESKPNLPVIVVTGYLDEAQARQATELGALDYLTKPIDFRGLSKVLSQL